jgi:hypothetical protein
MASSCPSVPSCALSSSTAVLYLTLSFHHSSSTPVSFSTPSIAGGLSSGGRDEIGGYVLNLYFRTPYPLFVFTIHKPLSVRLSVVKSHAPSSITFSSFDLVASSFNCPLPRAPHPVRPPRARPTTVPTFQLLSSKPLVIVSHACCKACTFILPAVWMGHAQFFLSVILHRILFLVPPPPFFFPIQLYHRDSEFRRCHPFSRCVR